MQPKKSTSFLLVDFLFKPQAWYGITLQRVWCRRRRMASPKAHFLRLDSIPSYNGFHTMLCIDSIHAFGVIVTHVFKSIRKLLKISFLSFAKAMAYHHALACISPPKKHIINRWLYSFRNDYIQSFVLMIYHNKLIILKYFIIINKQFLRYKKSTHNQ